MSRNPKALFATALLACFSLGQGANAAVQFEDLGLAIRVDPVSIVTSTKDAQGNRLAFGLVRDKGSAYYDVFVADIETGAVEWLGLQ